MRIQETVRKPMTEAKYLNVDNTDRYRPIMRLFYLKYEKLKRTAPCCTVPSASCMRGAQCAPARVAMS